MPNNVKTYNETGDPEDHVKVFQAAAQVERWAMPTWCHMFNSTLIGAARVWFYELPPESIDGYKDLRAAFLAYFMQQKNYVKDLVEIHNIKQMDGETIEDFMERFKTETGCMGAPECMRISGFMHGVNNPELTKRMNEHVPKTMEEMMITTTAFIRGEAAAASKKKGHVSWKPHDQSKRHSLDKSSDFRASKFQPPPPMVTPVEKRSNNKFRDFHNDKGHSTDACMQLKKQIEELVRAGKFSHLLKEIKQGREQPTTRKKEAATKDKPMTIYMVQSWQRTVKQKLAEADKEKTAFHTGQRVYCYTKTPFGLKNAGAMYQRLMDKAFEGQVGWNIEVYVDDLVVKSYTEAEMMRDIEETFRTLRKVNMKLNPQKCSFGLAAGVFLGYVITPEGIKPCLEKTAAVLQLPSSRTIKECGPDDRTGKEPDANLLYKPRVTGSETKLLADGETGLVTGLRSKETLTFTASNNEAEYEVLVAGLRIAAQMGVKNLQVNVDSKLVANQVLGTYVAKKDNMIKYLEIVKGLVRGFTTFSISQVPRSKNKKADALSKIASTSFAHLSKQVLVEVLENKSIKKKEVAAVIEEDEPTWMTQLVDYLKGVVLPGDKKEERKLRLKAHQYELMEGVLYRRSFLTPWLRCVGPLQTDYVMREIHEGSCSMHAGPRSVVAKAIRLGYYWPTMHKDARDMIRKYSDCRIHRPITKHPQQPLTPITALWPFYKWGIDIAGPFPEGPGKVKFLIVAMDYFTKWIEAKAVATITGGQVKKFVWDNIVCRFGIPGEIISDNGKQFSDNPFKDWCDKLNITQRFASVKHPQSNGLVERANRSLGEGIKSRIGEENKNWVEETPSRPLGPPNNDQIKPRGSSAVCEAKAKSKMMKYYNARVRDMAFKPGDFVYRNNDARHAVAGGKLGPKWECPYEVTEALGNGAYKLRSTDGTILPRTWNIANLK
nr:reverse transcriptase domain-containing protein [Tanacetum cinerariifolium]